MVQHSVKKKMVLHMGCRVGEDPRPIIMGPVRWKWDRCRCHILTRKKWFLFCFDTRNNDWRFLLHWLGLPFFSRCLFSKASHGFLKLILEWKWKSQRNKFITLPLLLCLPCMVNDDKVIFSDSCVVWGDGN